MNEEIIVILDANQSMGEEFSESRFAETADDIECRDGNADADADDDNDNDMDPVFRRCGVVQNEFEVVSEDFLGTTKFDVARYIAQELVLYATTNGSSRKNTNSLDDLNQTRVLALITLGGRQQTVPSRQHFDFTGRKRKRKRNRLLWSSEKSKETDMGKSEGESETEDETKSWRMHATNDGGCCWCYYSIDDDHKTSMDCFQNILGNLSPSSSSFSSRRETPTPGDLVTGIVRATDALKENTTVGASRRRIVLVTDARHKVLEHVPTKTKDGSSPNIDPMDELVNAINCLRTVNCTLEVVGMGFRRKTSGGQNDEKTSNATAEDINDEDESDGDTSNGDGDSDDGSNDDNDDGDEEEEDWSDVQNQNELLLVDLVEKLGGWVFAVNGNSRTKASDFYGVRTVLNQLALGPSLTRRTKEASPEMSSNIVTTGISAGAIAIAENRDDSSLRPSPGTRILYWNGSDDVLLPEWTRVARPSYWRKDVDGGDNNFSDACSWIQIVDPLRPPQPADEKLLLLENDHLSRYRCSLSLEAEDDIARGSQLKSSYEQQQQQCILQSVLERAKADGYGVPGSWLVDCPLENADFLWGKIAVATAYGKLGPTSRVFPTKRLDPFGDEVPEHNSCNSEKHPTAVVIQVGVNDSTDRTEIKRIFETLRKDLEIHSGLLSFQTNSVANVEKDKSSNRSQLPSYLYTAKEVLLW